MVKMERDVDVGVEDCIDLKMEDVFTPSVCIIKTEQEVSVVCWCDLFTGVCACVLYCTLYLVVDFFYTCISHPFSLCL